MSNLKKTILIGTRSSKLALRQVQEVLRYLKLAHPQARFQVITIATRADANQHQPIDQLGRGAFVTELELALLAGEIDVAVHSLKDMPTSQKGELVIAAVARREDQRDALVDIWNIPLDELPQGARIGTGSPRRSAQLRHLRPDILVLPIRGNVPTRLEKANGKDFDGVVLAMAGLRRLGRQNDVAQILDPELIVPAPGQGAIALQVRQEDGDIAAMVRVIQDTNTAICVHAERSLLSSIGVGCQVPFGAYATIDGDILTLTGALALETGKKVYKATSSGHTMDPEGVAKLVYKELLALGAPGILDALSGVSE